MIIQPRFRNTLRPAAGSATTTFLFAPAAFPLNAALPFAAAVVAVVVFFVTGEALTARPRFAFVTMVVLLLVVLISDTVVWELGTR